MIKIEQKTNKPNKLLSMPLIVIHFSTHLNLFCPLRNLHQEFVFRIQYIELHKIKTSDIMRGDWMKFNALTTTTANSYRLHLKTGQCTHSKPLLWKGYKTFTEHNNLWKLNSPRVIYLVIPDDLSYLYIIFGFVVFWRGRGGGDKKHSEPSQQWIMKNKFTLIPQQEWTTSTLL